MKVELNKFSDHRSCIFSFVFCIHLSLWKSSTLVVSLLVVLQLLLFCIPKQLILISRTVCVFFLNVQVMLLSLSRACLPHFLTLAISTTLNQQAGLSSVYIKFTRQYSSLSISQIYLLVCLS